eukprot:m.583427 g.583427  ORF g.583427 m.583427 type:complete len:380 (-) comp22339_c1_seq2:365-1504(-)
MSRVGIMPFTRGIIVLTLFIGSTNSQTYNMTGWAPQWMSNTSGCSNTPHVEAECAELSAGIEYVNTSTSNPRFGGGGLFWAPPAAPSSHAFCSPVATGTASNPCGRATFRLYCSAPATVIFQAQVRAYSQSGSDRGRDDSFWAWIDDREWFLLFASSFPGDRWQRRTLWGNGVILTAGTHDLVIAEREDGTMMRHMTMLSGYPACQFGMPPPGHNISTLELSEALDDAQVRLVNATNQIAALQSTQLQANMTIQNMSQMVASLSGQLSTLQGSTVTNFTSLSSQVASTTQNLTARVGNTESRIATMLQGLAAVVPPSTGGGSGAVSATVSQTGSDVVVSAPGSVKFTSGGGGAASQCYQTDLCDLAQALNAALAVFGSV